MVDVDWDIRGEGRAWKGAEAFERHSVAPGRLEMVAGKLCVTDDERIILLGLLLENIGAERAVQLGDPEVWRTAIERLAALD